MIDNFARLLGYFVMGCSVMFCASVVVGALMNVIFEQIIQARNLHWVARAVQHYKTIEPMPKDLKNENNS